MISFFEHQDRARRSTRLLVFLMGLGVVGIGAALHGVLVLMAFMTGGPGFAQRAASLDVFVGTVTATALVVGAASTIRALTLQGGGARIAEMLGGRLVSNAPRDVLERRLVNVVEEMAIASGVPVPQVFVLDHERSINAFAAGFTLDDAAIAVTRGTLEALTRDELQGVIAHEFSHILNGDMRLNLHLMGVVFGIVCIGLLGRFLMRSARSSGSIFSRRNNNRAMFAVCGFFVFLVGLVGELFGKLIKAAVSRQREFLADASAVQFTRNPAGIAGALKKIGGLSAGSVISGARAEEASHLFFGDIHRSFLSFRIFATHPPLEERIRRIEPTFQGEFPRVLPGVIAEPEDRPYVPLVPRKAPAIEAKPKALVEHLGQASNEAVAYGQRLLGELPKELRDAAHSPFSACAIVYALLIADEPEVRRLQAKAVAELSSPALWAEALAKLSLVRSVDRRHRLPLVELLAPALRELSEPQRVAFARTVQALSEADRKICVFEYVLGDTLKRWLDPQKSPRARGHASFRSLRAVRGELELLLSLIVHAGAPDEAARQHAFAQGTARIRELGLTLLPANNRLLSALSPALGKLSQLLPQLRGEVVEACAAAVMADGHVSDDQATLLAAVCGALACPMPHL